MRAATDRPRRASRHVPDAEATRAERARRDAEDAEERERAARRTAAWESLRPRERARIEEEARAQLGEAARFPAILMALCLATMEARRRSPA